MRRARIAAVAAGAILAGAALWWILREDRPADPGPPQDGIPAASALSTPEPTAPAATGAVEGRGTSLRPAARRESGSPAWNEGAGSPTALEDPRSGPISLAGDVMDLEGAPVAGGAIRITPDGGAAEGPMNRLARTDGEGRFSFRGLARGPWFLSVRRDGFFPILGLRVEIPDPQPLTVILAPDRPAILQVIDAAGAPLTGVRITARAAPLETGAPPPQALRAVTGPDGEAPLPGLPEEDSAAVSIEAGLAGRAGAFLETTAGVLRAGKTRIILVPGASLGGLVVDAAGTAQANVRIILIGASGGGPPRLDARRWVLHSTVAGAFRFPALPAGEFTLYADGGDRGGRRITGLRTEAGAASPDLRVELAPSDSPEAQAAAPPPQALVVRSHRAGPLPGTGTILGRIISKGPVPFFSIGIQETGAAGEPTRRIYRQSARRAAFQLTGVPAGTWDLLLIVAGEVRARAAAVAVAPGAATGPVELHLEKE